MAAAREDRSLGELIRELSAETGDLLHQEIALAKAEMAEKASFLGARAGQVALGAGLALLGAFALLAAVTIGLAMVFDAFMATELAAWLAPLVVGAALAWTGYATIRKALDEIRGEGMAPRLTTHTLQENKLWLKEKMQ
jgi:hypothetical protein